MAKNFKCPDCQLNNIKEGQRVSKVCSIEDNYQVIQYKYQLYTLDNTYLMHGDSTICNHCEYLKRDYHYFCHEDF